MTDGLNVATGRYGNPEVATCGRVPVGITRYPPKFPLRYELKMNLYDLAPSPALLQLAKGENGREKFIAAYTERLNSIGGAEIVRQLRCAQGDSGGVILLCYEDVTTGENWCHRLLLGAWLKEHAGLDVEEIHDEGRKDAKKKPNPKQGTLL